MTAQKCIYCHATDTELRPIMWRYGTDEVTAWRCEDKAACQKRPTYHQPFEAVRIRGLNR